MNILKPKRILPLIIACALFLSLSLTTHQPAFADDDEDVVQQDVENEVETEVESEVEKEVESEVEGEVEKEVEDEVEKEVEDEVEDEVETEVESETEDELEKDVEDDVEREVDDASDSSDKASEALTASIIVSKQVNSKLDKVITLAKDFDNAKIYSDNWLVLSRTNDDFLTSKGYRVMAKTYLPSLDKNLIRVEAPVSFKSSQALKNRLERLNTKQRAVDFNHIYDLSAGKLVPGSQQSPKALMALTPPKARQKVGIIDTQINTKHPALIGKSVSLQDFSEQKPSSISGHGNAVASILIGRDKHYQGVLSNVDIYAASVFFTDQKSGDITTTQSLIQALDWLVNQKVKVINMSLAGPPNRVLAQAINQYCQQGVIIVAAVGNKGPHAKPLFPAAYDCVVGVTAISHKERIYRRAGRGAQVDIAAYGVNILAANYAGGYSKVTGTSYATPFVTAFIVSKLANATETETVEKVQPTAQWLQALFSGAKDLGPPGKDAIYGYGALILSD